MKDIYLDNSATTALSDAAREAMIGAMEHYGNPSSLHPVGQSAHEVLEDARRRIGATLGIKRGEGSRLLFTASGTEGDNLAILGTAYAKPRRKGGRIITTDSEHPAVDRTLTYLEQNGFEVVRIPTVGGVLDLDAYEKALDTRTFLVTLMAVNNETGAAYDLRTAFAMAKEKNADIVTHTDGVQGYLKGRLDPRALLCDLVTVSAHKIHGPKGVGALYVSAEALKRRDLVPVVHGGGQEDGFRSGTENLIGITGFAAAAEEGYASMSADVARMRELRAHAIERLEGSELRVNLPRGASAPHILNVTLPDIRSETMLHELSKSGICISQGSACAAHGGDVSRALLAFGLTRREAECSVRVSFSRYSTEAEADALCDALLEATGRLVRIKR